MRTSASIVGAIVVVAAAIVAAPCRADAQPSSTKIPRVGFLLPAPIPSFVENFKEALRDQGWREGENIVIDVRTTNDRDERIADMMTELVALKVDVVVLTAMAVRQAKPVAQNIPIVFTTTEDPVQAGLVSSFARPGGRMTGITSLNLALDAKRLEILKSALPGVSRVGVLTTSRDPMTRDRIASVERAARALGVHVEFLDASTGPSIATALESAGRKRLGAVMVLGSPSFFVEQRRIAEAAMTARVPVISAWKQFAEAGGLMAYGTNVPAMFRRAASFVDRILRGANPADLPVEQANTFELVVNAKAARALNVSIPSAMLLRADTVIQ